MITKLIIMQKLKTEFIHNIRIPIHATNRISKLFYEILDKFLNLFLDNKQINRTKKQEMEIPFISNWEQMWKPRITNMNISGYMNIIIINKTMNKL